jgi:hypothetical protein
MPIVEAIIRWASFLAFFGKTNARMATEGATG